MPRSRNIKPGFFKNELLAEQPPINRLLFEGLWILADREGRLEDRPKRIKAELLPYDKVDVDKALGQLAEATENGGSQAFIVRYERDGHHYIQVVNFTKHQSPTKREVESVIPCPTEDETRPTQGSDRDDTRLSSRARADSLNLITDSLNLITDSLNLNTEERAALDNLDPNISQPKHDPVGFNRWYDLYPVKKSRSDAVNRWDALKPNRELVDTMCAATEEQSQWDEYVSTGFEFMKHPATWLNKEGWTDEQKKGQQTPTVSDEEVNF